MYHLLVMMSAHLCARVHRINGRVFSSKEIEKYKDVDAVQVVAGNTVVGVGQAAPLLRQVPRSVNAVSGGPFLESLFTIKKDHLQCEVATLKT